MEKRHNLILLNVFIILSIGLLTMFSISKNKGFLFEKHLTNIIFSILFYFFFLKLKIPKRFFLLYYFITIFLLLLPIFLSPFPKRWIKIGIISFQPSEIAKVPFFISLSIFLENKLKINFKESFFLFLLCLFPFLLVLLEPDLGSSLFYLLSFYVLILFKKNKIDIKFFYTLPPLFLISSFNPFAFSFFLIISLILLTFLEIKIFNKIIIFSISIIVGLLAPFSWNKILKDYQRERIKIFLNILKDPKGSGWQLNQGLIAIGSGGIIGKGFLKGSQKGLAFLPAAHSDFIFASFAEEFGFLGSIFLFLLYFIFFNNLLYIIKEKEPFLETFSLLTFFAFFYPFVLNIGGEIGILPLTGIPLPFLSYGGTNLLTNFLLLSLLRNFQRSIFYKW
jgi:rod shape determining protein RodA